LLSSQLIIIGRDHAGGNQLVVDRYHVPVYGGDPRIQALTNLLTKESPSFSIGQFQLQCLFTPCHTSGHVCYYWPSTSSDPASTPSVVFTGDTLFLSGCGKFFEGTAEQMYHSLNVLTALPSTTLVYPGHEYTKKNMKFALTIEPDNKALIDAYKKGPIVPRSIATELKLNPFLRTSEPSIQTTLNETDPIAVLAKLRQLKDQFK